MTPSIKKNAVALKRHVSAEFKEYCRSYSAYRLWFRVEGPHQLSSSSSLAFLRNCNIFCFWNGQRQCNWRVWLGPMRVTDKRLTHFLFPVTVLTLCGFLRFPGWKWKFIWGRCKRPFRTCVLFRVLLSRDLSRLPQLESLLAGYVLPSQFVDDSYTWVKR